MKQRSENFFAGRGKEILLAAGVFLALWGIAALYLHGFLSQQTGKDASETWCLFDEEMSQSAVALKEQDSLSQTFTVDSQMQAVSIALNSTASGQIKLSFSIYDDDGEKIYDAPAEQKANANENFWYELSLNTSKPLEPQQTYVLDVKILQAPADLSVLVVNDGGQATINGQEIGGTICLLATGTAFPYLALLYCFLAALLGTGILLLLLNFCKKLDFLRMYLVLLILFCGWYTVLFLPGQVPDEPAHFEKACQTASVLTGKTIKNGGEQQIWMLNQEQGSRMLAGYRTTSKDVWQETAETSGEYVESSYIKTSVFTHFPAAIGVIFSRVLQFNWIKSFYLARFFNMAFYILCCYFAVKWMPIGREILACVSLIPMSLMLGISCSYDCIQNAVCFLFLSVCLKIAFGEEPIKHSQLILCGLLGVALAQFKMSCALLLLLFLIPIHRLGKKKGYFGYLAAVIAISGLSFVAANFFNIGKVVDRTGEATYSLSYWLGGGLVRLPEIWINTLVNLGDSLFKNVYGYLLGWQKVPVHDALIIGMMLVTVFSAQLETPDKLKWRHRAILVITALGSSALLFIAAGSSTSIASNNILGLQGRYFLYLLPLMLLAGSGIFQINQGNRENIGKNLLFWQGILQCGVLFDVFRYYIVR